MRDDRERLLDIQEAIERIEKYAERGRGAFEQEELIQTWTLHHLQIVGEAVRSLSPEFRSKHVDIPWSKAIGLRHILVHEYFDIDIDIVWSVVEHDLPPFKQAVLAILNNWSNVDENQLE